MAQRKTLIPPTWLIDRVDWWRKQIGVYDPWNFTTGVRPALEENRVAECRPIVRENRVYLLFRSDRVTPGRDLDLDIVHELIHVVDAWRYHFIHHRVLPHITDERIRGMLATLHDDRLESEVEQLANAIVDGYAGRPKPGDAAYKPANKISRRRRPAPRRRRK